MNAQWQYGLHAIEETAQRVLDAIGNSRMVLVDGEMGAGKTTLIKAMCKALGVEDVISSPTFSIVNEYVAGDQHVYHFDFYRINDVQEAIDMGAEDYFYSGHYCFVEWASKVENIIPDDYFLVSLNVEDQETRLITLTHGE